MVVLVAVPAYVLLNHSRWGRYLFAIGSNKEAARLSGVNVKAITYLAYVLCSLFCAAFVGVLLAMRIGIGNPDPGPRAMNCRRSPRRSSAATSLFGAVGSVHGPLIGSLILRRSATAPICSTSTRSGRRIITGALIIIVVYFDSLRRRKR